MNLVSRPLSELSGSAQVGRASALAKRAISPRWRWLSLVALLIAVTCLRLSAWQFDRLAERTAVLATAATRAEAPPLALDALGTLEGLLSLPASELAGYTMRRASVRGWFDHEHDEALTMQVVEGRLGVRLLSPLRVSGIDAAVLVDRGWLPVDYDRPIKWLPFRISGRVAIEGRLRPGFRRPRTGLADAEAGLVHDLDLDQLAATLPYPLLRLVLVESPEAGTHTADALPLKRELQAPQSDLPHLAYAVQWLAFAVIVVGGYIGLLASTAGPVRTLPRVRPSSQ